MIGAGLQFFVGLHQPSDARHFDRCMVSVNRIRGRISAFPVNDWMMDSGAFTEVSTHGRYRSGVSEYARQVRRWVTNGNMLAAVSQDFMCEPFILERCGSTVVEHQRKTIERYRDLRACDLAGAYLMPVLQGHLPEQYSAHVEAYGDSLAPGAWVGVGSVCKRNSNSREILAVFRAIRSVRPDLRLHGFGVKTTALQNSSVRACLYSADSMAWSFAARKAGRDGNSWREAQAFAKRIECLASTNPLPLFAS